MKPKLEDVVVVEWKDITQYAGRTDKEIEEENCRIQYTAGWIHAFVNNEYKLVYTYDSEGEESDFISIPVGCVNEIYRFKQIKEKKRK